MSEQGHQGLPERYLSLSRYSARGTEQNFEINRASHARNTSRAIERDTERKVGS